MKESKEHIEDFDLPESLKELQGQNPFTVPEGFFSGQKVILESLSTPKVSLFSKSSLFSLPKLAIAASVAIVITVVVVLNQVPSNGKEDSYVERNDTTQVELQDNGAIPQKDPVAQHTIKTEDLNEVKPENEVQIRDVIRIQDEEHKDSYAVEEKHNIAPGIDKMISKERGDDRSPKNEHNPSDQSLWNEVQGSSVSLASQSSPVENGTSATSSARLTTRSSLGLSLGDDQVSLDPVRLIARSELKKKPFYKWSTGDSTSSIFVKESGTYWVKVSATKDMNECDYDTVEVIIVPRPARILGKDLKVCNGKKLTLAALTTNPHYTYSWNHGEYAGQSLDLGQLSPGIYEYALTINACGEQFSDDIIVEVVDCSIDVPNIITPNNDGRNDQFVITGLESYPGSELVIQNRNGRIVYQSKDYQNDWTAEGLEDGTYFYLLILADDNKKEMAGTITVMRR